mmetsp:Transcript_20342/g.77881  ORF Transcript_20342/g.77881 Transcript_20342/m.77881 type:complete len:488 (-) Transcript_20342:757-2220(-)
MHLECGILAGEGVDNSLLLDDVVRHLLQALLQFRLRGRAVCLQLHLALELLDGGLLGLEFLAVGEVKVVELLACGSQFLGKREAVKLELLDARPLLLQPRLRLVQLHAQQLLLLRRLPLHLHEGFGEGLEALLGDVELVGELVALRDDFNHFFVAPQCIRLSRSRVKIIARIQGRLREIEDLRILLLQHLGGPLLVASQLLAQCGGVLDVSLDLRSVPLSLLPQPLELFHRPVQRPAQLRHLLLQRLPPLRRLLPLPLLLRSPLLQLVLQFFPPARFLLQVPRLAHLQLPLDRAVVLELNGEFAGALLEGSELVFLLLQGCLELDLLAVPGAELGVQFLPLLFEGIDLGGEEGLLLLETLHLRLAALHDLLELRMSVRELLCLLLEAGEPALRQPTFHRQVALLCGQLTQLCPRVLQLCRCVSELCLQPAHCSALALVPLTLCHMRQWRRQWRRLWRQRRGRRSLSVSRCFLDLSLSLGLRKSVIYR